MLIKNTNQGFVSISLKKGLSLLRHSKAKNIIKITLKILTSYLVPHFSVGIKVAIEGKGNITYVTNRPLKLFKSSL